MTRKILRLFGNAFVEYVLETTVRNALLIQTGETQDLTFAAALILAPALRRVCTIVMWLLSTAWCRGV
jgi:hypothetical protein